MQLYAALTSRVPPPRRQRGSGKLGASRAVLVRQLSTCVLRAAGKAFISSIAAPATCGDAMLRAGKRLR